MRRFKEPIYGSTLDVYVTTDFQRLLRRLQLQSRSAYDPESAEDYAHSQAAMAAYVDEWCHLLVVIKPKSSPEVCAHEALHCASHVWKSIGAKMDVTNDEPFAYLTQFYATKIHEAARS